jgi:hypothetical protein
MLISNSFISEFLIRAVLLSGFITFWMRGVRLPVTRFSCGILDFVYCIACFMFWVPPWSDVLLEKFIVADMMKKLSLVFTWFLDFVHHPEYRTELLLFLSSSNSFSPFVQSTYTAPCHWAYSEPAHFTPYLLESIVSSCIYLCLTSAPHWGLDIHLLIQPETSKFPKGNKNITKIICWHTRHNISLEL